MRIKLIEWAVLIGLLGLGVVSAWMIYSGANGVRHTDDKHLVYLAERFVNAKVSLDPSKGLPPGDYVDYGGRLYVYFGPMAAAVLMPVVWFLGIETPQVLVGVVSWLVTLMLVYRVAKKMKYSPRDRLWWAIFFGLSTVMFFVSVVNITAYQVQALGVVFSFLFLDEYWGKKRWWLMGVWLALAGMTRLPLYLLGGFVGLEWLQKRVKLRDLVMLSVPVVVSVMMLGLYNYKRFGSLAESGYRYNVTLNDYPMGANVAHGFLSLKHVPANVYALFLKGVEPVYEPGGGLVLAFPWFRADAWGLSILITSPLLVYLLLAGKRIVWEMSAWLTVGLLLVPSLLYYGIGYSQFGYRYALDFLPLLTVLLMAKMGKKMGVMAKDLIVAGVLVNCLYTASIWNWYPHFGLEINREGRVVQVD